MLGFILTLILVLGWISISLIGMALKTFKPAIDLAGRILFIVFVVGGLLTSLIIGAFGSGFVGLLLAIVIITASSKTKHRRGDFV